MYLRRVQSHHCVDSASLMETIPVSMTVFLSVSKVKVLCRHQVLLLHRPCVLLLLLLLLWYLRMTFLSHYLPVSRQEWWASCCSWLVSEFVTWWKSQQQQTREDVRVMVADASIHSRRGGHWNRRKVTSCGQHGRRQPLDCSLMTCPKGPFFHRQPTNIVPTCQQRKRGEYNLTHSNSIQK